MPNARNRLIVLPEQQWICRAYRNHIARDKAKDLGTPVNCRGRSLPVHMTISASPAIIIPAYVYLFSLASPPHYAMPKRQDWQIDKHAVRAAFCKLCTYVYRVTYVLYKINEVNL